MSSYRTRTCMVQFRWNEIRFFNNVTVVPHAAPLAESQEAGSARLQQDNKNNRHRGITMHHYVVPQDLCPMQYLATRTHYIYAINPKNSSLPIRYIENTKHVTTVKITLAVRESIVLVGLLNSGYFPICISDHLLRASGAMSLRLNAQDSTSLRNSGAGQVQRS